MNRSIQRPYPNLKTWRDAQGWTQREAADHLGISQGYYDKLEKGSTIAKGETLKRIMQLTGVPIEVLVGVA